MENRQFTRVPIQIKGDLTQNEHQMTGDVRDLSLRGLFVETKDTQLTLGEVKISIYLDQKEHSIKIDVEGVVVRKDFDGLAILFKTIDIDSFIHLKKLVSYNLGDSDQINREVEHLFHS